MSTLREIPSWRAARLWFPPHAASAARMRVRSSPPGARAAGGSAEGSVRRSRRRREQAPAGAPATARGPSHSSTARSIDVAQLADVARPGVRAQRRHRRLAMIAGRARPRAQRLRRTRAPATADLAARSRSGGIVRVIAVEAEVEVAPEAAARHLRLEVAVGGGDEAHVDLARAGRRPRAAPRASRARAAAWPAARAAARRSRRGTPCRRRRGLEQAGLGLAGAGERAALVAEQLALEQRLATAPRS